MTDLVVFKKDLPSTEFRDKLEELGVVHLGVGIPE